MIRLNYFKLYQSSYFQNDEPLWLPKGDTRFTMSNNNYSIEIHKIMFEDAGYYRCDAFNGSVTGYINRTLIVIGMCDNIFYFSVCILSLLNRSVFIFSVHFQYIYFYYIYFEPIFMYSK